MIYNKEVHDYYTRQKLDVHHQFCRTNVAKNSGINMGIKLYNKLPPVIKNLEMTHEFKSRVKDFLMQHVLLSGRVFIFLGAMWISLLLLKTKMYTRLPHAEMNLEKYRNAEVE